MTVKELIEKLQQYDGKLDVVLEVDKRMCMAKNVSIYGNEVLIQP